MSSSKFPNIQNGYIMQTRLDEPGDLKEVTIEAEFNVDGSSENSNGEGNNSEGEDGGSNNITGNRKKNRESLIVWKGPQRLLFKKNPKQRLNTIEEIKSRLADFNESRQQILQGKA